ncbi:hypothetical protein KHA90_07825 [Flavobacterium psychroterrae]|uniref:Uncharacterized protein n=1 Tax=Flavobacterium psychroterrae TaxID=2133767 RepID=A0ABS5PAQ6_9FLAO|nr:hypothetical protein [Flavobacterium psychroterrae]MBS7230930.1 hypothetical protein [Flavobacterium psychroterrae]
MTKNRKFKLEGLIPNVLFSIKYDGEGKCEFVKLFEKWDDPLWLYNFFKANQADLNSGAWGSITIANAVRQTHAQAKEMKKLILSIANGQDDNFTILSQYFMPLINGKYGKLEWDKGKGLLKHNWLRIYAVRCSKNTYLITGGGIKLTRDMSPPHLQDELVKLQQAENYLRSGEDDQIDLCYLDL